jgi:RNA polymerase subunit RPABC4/transcription elongation factor Spt4
MDMSYRNCPKCGESVVGSAKFCSICGQTLKDVAFIRDYNEMEAKEATFPCPNCQMSLKPGTRHCPYCATFIAKTSYDLGGIKASRVYSGDKLGGLRFVLYLLSLFVPIAGIIVGVILMISSDPDTRELGTKVLIFGVICLVIAIIGWWILLGIASI